MQRLLAPFTEPVYAALRIVAGLMFAFHGVQKIFGILTENQPPVGSQLWIGGVIELVAGLMIAVGLFTSVAAFLASGTMAVAYLQFHWKFAFGAEFFPTINRGELALLYAFLFLFFACRGAGLASVDGMRNPQSDA
jgi:putative oxidoreductase